ncbi:MAG: hypothetical protein ACRDOU_23220, partial [Streptosporangiaceae bacterium]
MIDIGARRVVSMMFDRERLITGASGNYVSDQAHSSLARTARAMGLRPQQVRVLECGSVLIRDGARLERTFAIHPDYLDSGATQGAGEVNFADRGL